MAAAITGQAPSRVFELCAATIIEADHAAHDARLEAELRKRFVALTRLEAHGARTLIARIATGDAHAVDDLLSRVADLLAPRPELADLSRDELRAEAFAWLARPEDLLALLEDNPAAQRRRHRAVLYVHLHRAALDGGTAVARVEGLGPHTLAQVRRLLGQTEITVTPVIDLADEISVNAYEHPVRIAERIHLTHPGDTFPHASRLGRNLDLDHPIPYDPHGPPGQTSSHTGRPLTRTAHRAKTHLGYRSTPLPTGEILWRTPHGLHRIVDHTGTHVIDTDEADAWQSHDPLDHALTRIWHRHRTGAL